jgi:hypothetical protein
MADPKADAIARAHDRISDIVPIGLDHGQLARLTDVLAQVWDHGHHHGRNSQPSDEDRIRDAMDEATEHPGRIVTR